MQDKATRRAALTVASVALFTDAVLYGMAVPLLPERATSHGASTASVGLLFALYAGALVLTTPAAGWWLDRSGSRRPMIAGLLALAAATVLFALADTAWLLMLARALQGAAAGVTWTAALALIAATHPPAERGAAMGAALAAYGTGVLLGPPLGGLVADWLGDTAPFWIAAGLALLDGVARWTLLPRDRAPAPREGALELGGTGPAVALAAALAAFGAALIAFPEPILPLHLAGELDTGASAIGLVFAAGGIVAAAAPPLIGGLGARAHPLALAAAGAVVAAAGLLALPHPESVWLVAAAVAIVAFGAALVLTPTLAVMADLAEAADPPAYGAAYALYTLAYSAGLTAAPLLAGLAVGAWDFTAAVTGAAAIAVTAGVALMMPAMRRLTAIGQA